MIRSIILNHIHRYKCMLFDQYVRNGRDVSIIVREDNVHRAGGCRLDGSKQPGLRQGESSRGEEDGFRADQRFTYPHSIRQRGISFHSSSRLDYPFALRCGNSNSATIFVYVRFF